MRIAIDGVDVLLEAVAAPGGSPAAEGVRGRLRLTGTLPIVLHVMSIAATFIGSGMGSVPLGDPFDRRYRVLGVSPEWVHALLDEHARHELAQIVQGPISLDVEADQIELQVPASANPTVLQRLVALSIHLAKRLEILSAQRLHGLPGSEAAALRRGMQQQVDAATARRSRGSLVVLVVVLLFVAAVLIGAGALLVRQL